MLKATCNFPVHVKGKLCFALVHPHLYYFVAMPHDIRKKAIRFLFNFGLNIYIIPFAEFYNSMLELSHQVSNQRVIWVNCSLPCSWVNSLTW